MKLPAFQFYPGDWQKDLNLRRCSHGAKGVWMDTLCLMHESEDRGVLVTGDCPWSEKDWAAAVGGNADVTLNLITELLAKGVAKKRPSDGAIYCARMVREEDKRRKTNDRVKQYRERNAKDNAPETLPPTVTPEGEDEDEEIPVPPPKGESEGVSMLLNVPSAMELAEEIYGLYPRKVKRPSALRAILRAMKTYDSVMLRERTLAYAKAVTEAGYQFIPHPATWFNDEQFNDDPKTWIGYANNGKAHQANPRSIGFSAGAEERNAARAAAAARNAAQEPT